VQSAVVGRRVSGNEEVIAFVETMPGSTVDEAALKRFVRDRLAPYKRPQHVFVVGRMPRARPARCRSTRFRRSPMS
jgi:long-chain acyl-CoA synthetase